MAVGSRRASLAEMERELTIERTKAGRGESHPNAYTQGGASPASLRDSWAMFESDQFGIKGEICALKE